MNKILTYIMLLNMALFSSSCAGENARKTVWLGYHEYTSAAYATVHYDFQQESDGGFTLINCANRSPEEALIAIVPDKVADRLAEIVAEEKMSRYRKEYRALTHMEDGTSWDLSIQFEDGSTISSSGYSKRPRGNGLQGLKAYLDSVWEQVKDSARTVNLYEKY